MFCNRVCFIERVCGCQAILLNEYVMMMMTMMMIMMMIMMMELR